MKTCFKCNYKKGLSEFYRHPKMKDGRLNKCKECTKKDTRKNRKKNIEYYREYDRSRGMLPHRVKAREGYQQTEAGKRALARANKNYVERYPKKHAAQTALGNAVRDGKVGKWNFCESCGVDDDLLHGHHDDYAKPLEVRWLCPSCHREWHKENGEGLNAR